MRYEIRKIDNDGEKVIMDGDCITEEEALDVFIDCVIDHGVDDQWLLEDFTRIKYGKDEILFRKILKQLRQKGEHEETFISPRHGKPYALNLVLSYDEDEDGFEDELGLYKESWDPSFYDKPENQYGEKWMHITGTYLNGVLEDIIKDVQIDPFQDGPKLERLSLSCLNICEDGHLVAEFYGGANGGGFRDDDCNWKFYLSLIRKFVGKVLDYANGDFFKDVWLIDWSNDCCDDVWTLVLGLELSNKQKYHLVEGKPFSIVDPEKLGIEVEQVGVDTIIKPVQSFDTTVS